MTTVYDVEHVISTQDIVMARVPHDAALRSRATAWEIVNRISTKYAGGPYPRGEQRVVALIEPDRQSMG
jgi:hypothetical protein